MQQLMVQLWLPEGSSFAATEGVARRMEAKLAQDKDVADYVAYVGAGSPRFYLPLDQQLHATNLTEFMVVSRDIEARERLVLKLRQWIAADFPEVRQRIDRLPNGPPVSSCRPAPKCLPLHRRIRARARAYRQCVATRSRRTH